MTQHICFDFLGGAKYPDILKKVDEKYGRGYFWDEFGAIKGQIQQDIKDGVAYIRVQGIWNDHVFGEAQEAKAIAIGKELQKLVIPGQVIIEYSPYCEHRKKRDYMHNLLDKIHAVAPSILLVNSPISGGEWTTKYRNEIHAGSKPMGMPATAYNFSYDGTNCVDADVEMFKKLYAGADFFFYWVYQFNCHANKDDKKRNARPTLELIQSLIFIAEHSRLDVTLEKGWISKSHSQQNDTPTDSRANHVVLVGPKGKKFKKVTLGGVALEDGGMTEEKDPKQRRNTWRSKLWGYKQKRPLKVVADGKDKGTVDPAFRINEPRNSA